MTTPLQPHHARQNQLLLALLRSNRPLSGNELFGLVPEYRDSFTASGRTAALEKQFERDRAELIASGFRIGTVPDPEAPDDRARWRYQVESNTESVAIMHLDAEQILLIDSATRLWLDKGLQEDARRGYLKLLAGGTSRAESPASRPTARVSTHPVFGQLRSAIANGARISFDYVNQESHDPWPRTVDPLRLVVKSGRWLLHAWDVERDGHRNYLVNRIVSTPEVVGAADATHQADPNVEAQLDALAQANPVRVRVRIGTEAEARMRWRGTEISRAGEWAQFELRDWDHGILADELAGMAHLLVVESPAQLRERVTTRLQRALAAHGEAQA